MAVGTEQRSYVGDRQAGSAVAVPPDDRGARHEACHDRLLGGLDDAGEQRVQLYAGQRWAGGTLTARRP